ncbi:MAG TPA: ACP S-malonyltransferase [Mycobacteriales bacterium]
MLAVLCPGQGSQRPGQLAPWLEAPGAADLLAAWSEVARLDLVRAGTTASADEIRATEVTQPLLAATALLAARGIQADVLTGHSVGGWAAAAIAGVISDEDCVRLVAARGRAVAECCDGTTGMSAVLGGAPDVVLAAIESAGLTAANVNGGGQVVAAGDLDRLAALEIPGARVRSVPVAGAFHTTAMGPAVEALAGAATGVAAADPTTTLVSDADGTVVTDGPAHLRALVDGTARPVRFDLVWQRLADLGVDTIVELAPAGVLAGLAKRVLPGVRIVKAESPADLAAI